MVSILGQMLVYVASIDHTVDSHEAEAAANMFEHSSIYTPAQER